MRITRTLNKVMLIGNVGKDPDLKYTPSGIPVSSFRMATTESWKDRDGNVQEHTEWHTIVAWRGLAEVINKIVKKGARVYIEGKIQSRNYDDKSGGKRVFVEILADNMLLLEYKRGKNIGSSYGSDSYEGSDFADDLDIEINSLDDDSDDFSLPDKSDNTIF